MVENVKLYSIQLKMILYIFLYIYFEWLNLGETEKNKNVVASVVVPSSWKKTWVGIGQRRK